MTATEEALIQVLSKGLKLQRTGPMTPETAITRNVPAGTDTLGLDSVDILEIAVLLDKHFSVSLEEEDAQVHEALRNIGTLAAYIERKRGG
ncbi:MAG TPA: phosphopantetheine-binding protein [Phycisphaerae bacterium]|nr:phosphopantetheine-binding protein [Phycisphaerae bacterium]